MANVALSAALSAARMELWDRCRRAAAFALDWEPVRVTPLGAVYTSLRTILTADQYNGPGMARETVMQLASERGVQTDRPDPYDMIVHHAHLAEVLARALRQPSQEAVQVHPVVKVGSTGLVWQPEGYLVDGGTRLMRVVLVDDWTDDRQMAELHAWRTVGDVCLTGLPMVLRVLVIGASRNGRRHGYWTKARQHPYDKSLRFKRKEHVQEEFSESWHTVWRENTKVDADHWIEQMSRDNVLREVAFTRNVMVPNQRARDMVVEDVTRIGTEIETAKKNHSQFPMTRSSCDMAGPGRGPCLYQSTCYSPIEIDPGQTGLFRRR